MAEPSYHDSLRDVIAYWKGRALDAENECKKLKEQMKTMLDVAERAHGDAWDADKEWK